jgi:hypothetical protein
LTRTNDRTAINIGATGDAFVGATGANNVSAAGITFTPADGRFTVSTAGTYDIAPTLMAEGTGTPTSATYVIQKNGSSVWSYS